jgi:hypothetical protein
MNHNPSCQFFKCLLVNLTESFICAQLCAFIRTRAYLSVSVGMCICTWFVCVCVCVCEGGSGQEHVRISCALTQMSNFEQKFIMKSTKGFGVLTMLFFWVVTPCGLVGNYQRFGEI